MGWRHWKCTQSPEAGALDFRPLHLTSETDLSYFFPGKQIAGQEETASRCTPGGLDWTLGKIYPLKVLSSIGSDCPEGGWVIIPGGV